MCFTSDLTVTQYRSRSSPSYKARNTKGSSVISVILLCTYILYLLSRSFSEFRVSKHLLILECFPIAPPPLRSSRERLLNFYITNDNELKIYISLRVNGVTESNREIWLPWRLFPFASPSQRPSNIFMAVSITCRGYYSETVQVTVRNNRILRHRVLSGAPCAPYVRG